MNSHSTAQAEAVTTSKGEPASPPSFPFAILFLVWLLVVVTATLVTFILPESFSSTARIKVERDQTDIGGMVERGGMVGYDPYFIQTEFELIQSEIILGKVIEDLDLNKEWGKKYANGERLKTSETMALLKGRIDLRPVRNASLIGIRVFGEQAEEAARIANAVAAAYRDFRLNQRVEKASAGIRGLEAAEEENTAQIRRIRAEMAELSRAPGTPDTNRLDEAGKRIEGLQHFGQMLLMKLAAEKADRNLPATGMVQLVDKALPGLRPVRPSKPLNILIATAVGGFGGLFLATLVYVLGRLEFRRRSGVPRTQFPPTFRAIVHILIALVVGFLVGYLCANPHDLATLIVVPLAFLVGGGVSAYIELANLRPISPPGAATSNSDPNKAAL
jgi:capsular polysaccharide biosynthesis protein